MPMTEQLPMTVLNVFYISLEVTFSEPLHIIDEQCSASAMSVGGYFQEIGITAHDDSEARGIIESLVHNEFPVSECTIRFSRIGIIDSAHIKSEIFDDDDIHDSLIQNPLLPGIWYKTGHAYYYDEQPRSRRSFFMRHLVVFMCISIAMIVLFQRQHISGEKPVSNRSTSFIVKQIESTGLDAAPLVESETTSGNYCGRPGAESLSASGAAFQAGSRAISLKPTKSPTPSATPSPRRGLSALNASNINQEMDIKLEASDLSSAYAEEMIATWRDRENDELVRNFAVQHLERYARECVVRGTWDPDASDAADIRAALEEAVLETGTSVGGAALLALARLSEIDPHVDRTRLGARASSLVSDSSAPAANRASAAQVCGLLRVRSALPALRSLSSDPATPTPLRLSADRAVTEIEGR